MNLMEKYCSANSIASFSGQITFFWSALIGFFVVFSSAHAQPLTIKSAIELRYPTSTNTGYRILQSGILTNWQVSGQQVFGDGASVSQLVAASNSAQFFRLDSFTVRNLNSILEQIRSSRNVPALACAVVVVKRKAVWAADYFQCSPHAPP